MPTRAKNLGLCTLLSLLSLGTAACGDAPAPDDPAESPDGPPAGYVRYRTPAITLQPGESGQRAQVVSAPFDADLDVADLIGTQTAGGHHALMYSSTRDEPVGTTRPWEDADQLVTRFVGGIGGEGAGAVELPEGVVFRIRAGSRMLIQTHYINTTAEPILGESVLDVKLVEPAAGAQVASLFGSTDIGVAVPPGESSMDVACVLQDDIRLLMWANHMHEHGFEVSTRLTDPDGATVDVKTDEPWDYGWALEPNFGHRSPEDPLVLPRGSTLETRCTWRNTGGEDVAFPDEMCVFFGLFLGDHDQNCVAGHWIE